MADEIDRDDFYASTITNMVEAIGNSIVEASAQMSRDQLAMLKDYPAELREFGVMPVFYHMQEVEVELKVVMEMSTELQKKDRNPLVGWIMGPKITQTDKLDASSASSMRMRFAPGPVQEANSSIPYAGDTPEDEV